MPIRARSSIATGLHLVEGRALVRLCRTVHHAHAQFTTPCSSQYTGRADAERRAAGRPAVLAHTQGEEIAVTTATIREQIPLEELASLPTFAFVTPSYSGDQIAFYWDKTGRFELYTMDLRTREVRQLTHGEAPKGLRAGLQWTRDDAAIIFVRDKDGDEQDNLFYLDRESGQVRQLNDDPRTQEYAGQVRPDHTRLSVMPNRAGQ